MMLSSVTSSQVFTGILWLVGINVILTIILLLFMTKYPKYIMLAYNRYLTFKYGISKKTIKTQDNVFTYMERGPPSAPTLVLVHGYSSSKESFFGIFNHFPRTKFHIVALDLPGHGGTPLKDTDIGIMLFVKALNEFVEALGLHQKKFHLIGGSMGGHVTGVYASEYPQNIFSLCMVCPHGIDHDRQRKMIEEAKATQKFMLLPQTVGELREMFEWLTTKKVEIPEIFLNGILHLRLEKNDFYKQLGEALVEPENNDLLERSLHKIETPVLLVWGKDDNVLHVECVDVIEKKLPRPPKKTVILEDVGHGVFLERPRKFMYIFLEFLDTLHHQTNQ